jgi:hypothetical protein
MNNSDKKEENKYQWIQTIAVFLILFYAIQAFFRWLFNSSSKEKVEGVIGGICIVFIAVVFYLLSCWITGMSIDLSGLFGFD